MLQMGANPALGLAPCACVDEYLVETARKSKIKISLKLISKTELNQIFSALILLWRCIYRLYLLKFLLTSVQV